MNETEFTEKFMNWLKSHYEDSDLVLEQESQLYLGGEKQKFRTDLVMIQSKSNVLHSFELKSKINLNAINSLIWQVDTMYGNYKWLVILDIDTNKLSLKNQLKEKGIGFVIYDSKKNNFKIEIQPKYIDGNFIEFYPSLKEKWNKKSEYGSNSRSKEKN